MEILSTLRKTKLYNPNFRPDFRSGNKPARVKKKQGVFCMARITRCLASTAITARKVVSVSQNALIPSVYVYTTLAFSWHFHQTMMELKNGPMAPLSTDMHVMAMIPPMPRAVIGMALFGIESASLTTAAEPAIVDFLQHHLPLDRHSKCQRFLTGAVIHTASMLSLCLIPSLVLCYLDTSQAKPVIYTMAGCQYILGFIAHQYGLFSSWQIVGNPADH